MIAPSQPFVVQANRNFKAIPSKERYADLRHVRQRRRIHAADDDSYGATNQFGNLGIMKYVMNAGTPRAWQIEYRQANNRDSMPFISSNHFMDMIFDGATPGTTSPAHTIYGSMAMTPTQTFSITSGGIAHLVMEVDGHQSFRRWLDIQIAPASDPLEGWDSSNHQINNADQALFLEFRDGFCTLDIYTGPRSASDPIPTGTAGGSSHGARLWGLAGSTGGAPIMCGADEMYVKKNFSRNGLGLDDKSRYDFFISENHAALFQDGQSIVQSDIPAGSFPWASGPLRAYFSHYLYHSDDDIIALPQFQLNGQNMCYQLNSYWFNNPQSGTAPGESVCNKTYPPGYGFRYSDERHWDNMGFEVLSASDAPAGDFSPLASLVQTPAIQAPGSGGFPPAAPTNLRIK